MLLHARPMTQVAMKAMTAAAPSAPRPQVVRPAQVTMPPQILHTGHAPAQLCFQFTRV
jgi:hypothetical protein